MTSWSPPSASSSTASTRSWTTSAGASSMGSVTATTLDPRTPAWTSRPRAMTGSSTHPAARTDRGPLAAQARIDDAVRPPTAPSTRRVVMTALTVATMALGAPAPAGAALSYVGQFGTAGSGPGALTTVGATRPPRTGRYTRLTASSAPLLDESCGTRPQERSSQPSQARPEHRSSCRTRSISPWTLGA